MIMKSNASATDSRFFDIDEMKDPVLALKVLDDHLAKVLAEPLYWKWAVLALHNALQGFMVLNLAGSNILDLMQNARSCPGCHREILTAICPGCGNEIEIFGKRSWGSRSEWQRYFDGLSGRGEKRATPKPPRLIHFTEMYGRIKDDRYVKRYFNSKKFRAKKRHNKAVQFLHNDLRNEFVHFMPKLLSDYAPAFLSEVKEILPIIAFLAFESGNVFWHRGGDGLEDEVKQLLEKLAHRVDTLEKAYSDQSLQA